MPEQKKSAKNRTAAGFALPDPEELIEEYTPLVVRTVSSYLSDREDVRECVNDVFYEFYKNIDKFDPDKGSCAAFLTDIARKRAVSRYRKERRHAAMRDGYTAPEDAAETADMEESLTDRLVLEDALSSLPEDELEIIRRKYYDGMTIQEIAKSMHLPYETVKKRHQRSLKKLRILLILLLLLLMLLAGCAIYLAHHLGIVPGFGVNTSEDMSFYIAEETEDAALSGTELFVSFRNVIYQNGILIVEYELKDSNGDALADEEVAQYYPYTASAAIGSQRYNVTSQGKYRDGELQYYLRLEFASEALGKQLLQEDAPVVTLEASVAKSAESETYTFTAQFTMTSLEEDTLEEYPYELVEGQGGVLAIPRLENGHLLVAVYTLQSGEGYLLPELTEYVLYDKYVLYNGIDGDLEPGVLTVTAADGTVLTGTNTSAAYSSALFYEWDFGEAEAGTYTLHIPYLLKVYPYTEETHILLDPSNGTFSDSPLLFGGGSIRLAAMESLTYEEVCRLSEEENFLDPAVVQDAEGVTYTADNLYWKLTFDVQMEQEDEIVWTMSFQTSNKEGQAYWEGYTTTEEARQNMIVATQLAYPTADKSVWLLQWYQGQLYNGITTEENLSLNVQAQSYSNALNGYNQGVYTRWNRSFDLEFTVD